ncbi:uncharacterized protein LOC142239564 [Haematobia irritans]|uniref:uncharacterized protein LOC142239564 n=1 Tax=Haematobia irritans TaxID=7368 RepID=UPI003F4F9E2C
MTDPQSVNDQNCKMCSEKDTEEMVQCDGCDQWYHFGCVGVDNEIANISWNCPNCRTALTSNGQIDLATHTSTPTSNGNGNGVVHYGNQSLLVTTSSDFVPSANVTATAKNFVRQPTTAFGTKTTSLVTAPISSISKTPLPSYHIPNSISMQTFTQANTSNLQPMSGVNVSMEQLAKQRNLELQKLEEEMEIKRQYLESKYKILSETSGNLIPTDQLITPGMSITSRTRGPTPEQVAARHAIPKQLPTFNGDPEEWPLFICSFENSTSVAGFSNEENLIRLQTALKGKAREIVKSKLLLPQMVPEIIETLRMCFGRPEHILDRAISKARNMPAIKDKLDALIEYAMCVRNICSTMEGCKLNSHLNNPLLVKELVDKLPNNYKLNWAMSLKDETTPVVKVFSDWLFQMAEAACTVTPMFGKVGSAINTHSREDDNTHPTSNQINSSRNNVSTMCVICSEPGHKVPKCETFKKMNLNEKWECIKGKNLCRQCLGRHRRKCYSNNECGVDGCKYKHHPLLHKKLDIQQSVAENIDQPIHQSPVVNAHNNKHDYSQPLFRIIPINIHTKNKITTLYAFLDEGSAVTLMEKSTFDELGIVGEGDPLCLRWTGDTTRMEADSVKANLDISGLTSNKKYKLIGVHTVCNLGLSAQTVDMHQIAKSYPYLSNLPLQSHFNAKPTILIGVDNWHLAVPLKVREGPRNQPIASKTRLGWTLQASSSETARDFRINMHSCDCQKKYEELHEMVKSYFTLESVRPTQLFSSEDNKAMHILERTCKLVNNHYETGLLWRDENVRLPASFNQALNRLDCLNKKMRKDPDLCTAIQTQISNLILKGYARKLTKEESEKHNDKTWYLPIFIVKNPNKPDKVRLVWDAASKSNGVSLNDFIMPGPDFLKPLVEILLKFRMDRVAICGDISEMFHRVNVRENDMHAQRFLWYEPNDEPHKPSVFVMKALTFGISCAPCIAHYIRNKNADLFKNKYPRAVAAIQEHHYVDDFIDCAPNEEEALQLAMQVKEIHEAASFKMHNWSSNSKMVLEMLNGPTLSHQNPKDLGSTTKILGLYWEPNDDEFRYICRFARLKRNILNEDLKPTKREALQVLMSIFDPLGFVSCYTIGLKLLLQDIWRSKIGWDEELSESLNQKWLKWKSNIHKIVTVRVSRCFYPTISNPEDVQLHTFVDAGENAYSAVCYLRAVENNNVSVSLVAAKSKVAPLKPFSIPRMELLAAQLGARLARTVAGIDRLKIRSKFWWTDAKTVLRWLQQDPKNFQQFVMHRVGEILEITNVDQWRWVPSKLNPADLSTKNPTPPNTQMWFEGPQFLRLSNTYWPQCSDFGPLDDTEIKRSALVIEKCAQLQLNFKYFSDWRRMYRATATFLLYCYRLKDMAVNKKSTKTYKIDSNTIEKAKLFLIRIAQQSEYRKDFLYLKNGKPVEKNSGILALNVYLDKNDVIKCRGRAEFLNNHEDIVVLPSKHHLTYLIVKSFHEKFYHQSHETALNEIRSHYYIPKLRVLFRRVRRDCQWCKLNNAKPNIPQMAALPAARLAAFERPFTFVGVDYFGPFHVSVGRRREKRWGVIFTCLTVRAVHIEVAFSLDTSSCIMAIRNFISRRGTPREFYSDNGTNFKAAEKIICNPLQEIDYTIVKGSFEQISWKFNPPAAPHMGGVWERLVRSIKTALYAICPSMSFTDESLRTALCEAEFIINCRPLTFVSLECSDDEAITPNHLLIGSSDGYKPIPTENIDLRQRWYKTQDFANKFWKRWLKEYVPIITKRSKWFIKQSPIKNGDVVVIVDPELPRNRWPKGIVINTVVAHDGQVRRAVVKTKQNTLERPVSKLAVLDVTGKPMSKLDPVDSFTGEGTVAA